MSIKTMIKNVVEKCKSFTKLEDGVENGEEEFYDVPENYRVLGAMDTIEDNDFLQDSSKVWTERDLVQGPVFTPEEDEAAKNIDPKSVNINCYKCSQELEGFDLYQAHQEIEHGTNKDQISLKLRKKFKGKPDALKKWVRKCQGLQGEVMGEEIYLSDIEKKKKEIGVITLNSHDELLKKVGLELKCETNWHDEYKNNKPYMVIVMKAIELKESKKYKDVFLVRSKDGYYGDDFEVWVRKK